MIDNLTKLSVAKLIDMLVKVNLMLDGEKAAYKQKCDPIKRTQIMLEGAITIKLDEEGVPSVSTGTHTAYFTNPSKATVSDRDSFLDWVFANQSRDLLTNHVSLEGLREISDLNNDLPPGVRVDRIRKLCIRKK